MTLQGCGLVSPEAASFSTGTILTNQGHEKLTLL